MQQPVNLAVIFDWAMPPRPPEAVRSRILSEPSRATLLRSRGPFGVWTPQRAQVVILSSGMALRLVRRDASGNFHAA